MERKENFAPEEYYHLYSRGVEKRKIFLNSKDYERFIALLYIMNQPGQFHLSNFLKNKKIRDVFEEKKSEKLVSILSYTLMPNHFHLLVYENKEGGISKFMSRLLTAYSMHFNTKYKRSGPLFTHPFRSQHISEEAQYLWIFSYIHLNALGIIKKGFKEKGIGDKRRA
jgi:putative transposase